MSVTVEMSRSLTASKTSSARQNCRHSGKGCIKGIGVTENKSRSGLISLKWLAGGARTGSCGLLPGSIRFPGHICVLQTGCTKAWPLLCRRWRDTKHVTHGRRAEYLGILRRSRLRGLCVTRNMSRWVSHPRGWVVVVRVMMRHWHLAAPGSPCRRRAVVFPGCT